MNKPLVGGVFIMILSIVLAVIMMALNGWVGNCQPGETSDSDGFPCAHIGVRVGTIDKPDGSSGSTFSLNGSDCPFGSVACGRFYDGGTIILATGIIAFVVFIVALVLLVVAHRNGAANYRYAALFGLNITSFLMVLGIVLYSYKQLAGYSFILMIISGFFYFTGVALILAGGWKITLKGDTAASSSNSDGKATGNESAKKNRDEEAI